jgi:outer membrane protein
MRYSPMLLAAVSAAALGVGADKALADDTANTGLKAGDILVRLRALDVQPDTSSTVSVIGGNAKITHDFVPEADVSYFITPHIALEEIAGITYHDVSDKGSALGRVPLGSVRLLPPTLTVQYHFLPDSKINPYVGAGINYTFFYGVHGSTVPIIYSTHYSDRFGEALQVGADVHISGNWFFNIDVKKVFLHTDVTLGTAAGQIKAKVDINPWLIGTGIGYRF